MKCTSRIKDPIVARFGTAIRNDKEFSITLVIFCNTSFIGIIRLFSLLISSSSLILILQLVALRFNVPFLFAVVTEFLSIFRLRSIPCITTRIPLLCPPSNNQTFSLSLRSNHKLLHLLLRIQIKHHILHPE